VRRHAVLDADRRCFVANDPIELAIVIGVQVVPRKQPHRRLAHAPLLPQQLQEPWRQHAVAILLAFALRDSEHHASAVDVGTFRLETS
jgi:hypothetical protein